MDITNALKEDHDELKELIATVNESDDAAEIKMSFTQFAELLAKHSKAEEKVVYDALIGTGDEENEMEGHEGYTEHMLAETLLKKMQQGADVTGPEWKAEAKVMQEILEHHIEEEEDEIFDAVDDSFDNDQREAMAAEFEKLKGEIQPA
jgi:hemerythrin superfamily protein